LPEGSENAPGEVNDKSRSGPSKPRPLSPGHVILRRPPTGPTGAHRVKPLPTMSDVPESTDTSLLVQEATAPRRSSRISSQPVKSVPEPAPTRRKASASTKKRTAAEADAGAEDGASAEAGSIEVGSKKAKKGEEDADAADEESVVPKPDPIDIGGFLPSLVIQNEKGEDVNAQDLTAEGGVVLFLVPKADTPGCTTQACGFRDIYPDFTAVNFDVYCLSADSPTAQTKWQTKKELPYALLSDPKRLLITALGAGDGGKTKRSHFVFKKGGELVDKKVPVKPADSPKLALEFIKSLSA
jgi:peroxiredoxin Q/BCP